jgi:hypothetical protein
MTIIKLIIVVKLITLEERFYEESLTAVRHDNSAQVMLKPTFRIKRCSWLLNSATAIDAGKELSILETSSRKRRKLFYFLTETK